MQVLSVCVCTNLSQRCGSVHDGQQRPLISGPQVQVHNLVGEGGELVAEAHLVGAAGGCGVGEAVVLLLALVIQHVAQRVCHEAVHIVVPPCNHLNNTCITLKI